MEQPKKYLEGMLRAIQDLKSEKYIGTQVAWDILKANQAVYEMPLQAATEINTRAALKNGDYKATPRRLNGILTLVKLVENITAKIFSQCFNDAIEANTQFSSYRLANNDILFPFYLDYFSFVFSRDKKLEQVLTCKVEDTASYLGELFAYANKSKVKTDEDFGSFLAAYIAGKQEIRQSKIRTLSAVIDDIRTNTLSALATADWNYKREERANRNNKSRSSSM